MLVSPRVLIVVSLELDVQLSKVSGRLEQVVVALRQQLELLHILSPYETPVPLDNHAVGVRVLVEGLQQSVPQLDLVG